jgi:hypothetical protein
LVGERDGQHAPYGLLDDVLCVLVDRTRSGLDVANPTLSAPLLQDKELSHHRERDERECVPFGNGCWAVADSRSKS